MLHPLINSENASSVAGLGSFISVDTQIYVSAACRHHHPLHALISGFPLAAAHHANLHPRKQLAPVVVCEFAWRCCCLAAPAAAAGTVSACVRRGLLLLRHQLLLFCCCWLHMCAMHVQMQVWWQGLPKAPCKVLHKQVSAQPNVACSCCSSE
jgi:hypothetical protein